MLVAGLDVGGSAVKAWARDPVSGRTCSVTEPLPTLRPAPHRAELDPGVWERACRRALAAVVERAGGDWLGVTVSTLRQGFVLLDATGEVLGNGVLNSDRRGGPFADVLAGTHPLTGHWPAPELTLPKLLAVQQDEPQRWAATSRVLFLHDWLLQRMTGVQVTETSYACAGGMADVAARSWAHDLLASVGVADRVAPLVEAGTVVGWLRTGWGLPVGVPVVAGCGDTQLAAAGVGGLADGVAVVVAGSSTPVTVATSEPVRDPLARPWVSTHAAPGLWAAEGNAGYPGTVSGWWEGLVGAGPHEDPGDLLAVTATPYWAQQTWAVKPPATLLGLDAGTTAGQVRGALALAHAYAVRGNLDDLERAVGHPLREVVVTGGAAADGRLPALMAEVSGRSVRVAAEGAASVAGAALVASALGADLREPGLPSTCLPAGDRAAHDAAYQRWCRAHEALRIAFGEG